MRTPKRAALRAHDWLSQVEVTGVVLSEPVLAEESPTGFTSPEKKDIAKYRKAMEIWNLPKGVIDNPDRHWMNFILEEVLELVSKYWLTGAAITHEHVTKLIEQNEDIRPTRVLIDKGKPVMHFMQVPREQSLDKTWTDKNRSWKASPTTKMERLLRDTEVEIGLLTNGEAWRLVVASPSETASWLTWTAQTWWDSPNTLAAFKNLLGASRFFAGPEDRVILELVRKSRERQLEITEKLGEQVRDSVRLFIFELDRINLEYDGKLLEGYDEKELYEACVTFMMRLLFLLYAEENALLPHGNVTYDESFGVTHLLTELENQYRLDSDSLLYSKEAYSRLLALFRLVHEGSPDPDIRIQAHGGRLFDPNRFPILEGRKKSGFWVPDHHESLPVRDTIVRDMLRSLKYAEGDSRIKQLVSYRSLAVEQIGYMYEGLLDVKFVRAPENEPLFEIVGTKDNPFATISPSEMEGLDEKALVKLLSDKTGKSVTGLTKILDPEIGFKRKIDPGTEDPELLELAQPVFQLLKRKGIVKPGFLYLTKGEDRRSTGTHYTPPELTEPIVRHTLEPLVYCGENGKLDEPLKVKSPREILDLNVCDMAMGSGAFLVQAVRYLSSRLVESWEAIMASDPEMLLTFPFAEPAQGITNEHLMPGSGTNGDSKGNNEVADPRQELELWAKRYVATKCIYGVDINHLAVEMAKLSIWLETHSKDRPFTFLDHSLKCGDSLVGVDRRQLIAWSLDRAAKVQDELFDPMNEELIHKVIKLREEIAEMPSFSTREVLLKERKLQEVEDMLSILKMGGDLLIASHFGAATPKARLHLTQTLKIQYWNLTAEVRNLGAKIEYKTLESFVAACNMKEKYIADTRTFHWQLEFPEVMESSGFDAIVGNPPFLGGTRITEVLGQSFWDYLPIRFHKRKKTADLCAYFVLMANRLLNSSGFLGLITTKTIFQTDSREVSLQYLLSKGCSIYRARKTFKWPGKATVQISVVHVSKNKWLSSPVLNGVPVTNISSQLEAILELKDPYVLSSMKGRALTGSCVLGTGFLLSHTEANTLLEKDVRYKNHIFPYLTGKDFNDSPTQSPSRWAINMFEMNEAEIMELPDLYEILLKRVKPERIVKDKVKYPRMVNEWWKYWHARHQLYKFAQKRTRLLVRSRVCGRHIVGFVPNNYVYSDVVIVFDVEDWLDLAIIQSTIHEIWLRSYASTMRTDTRYVPPKCWDTFPYPILSDKLIIEFSSIAKAYDELRLFITETNNIGLTKVYREFNNTRSNDDNILRLRELHQQLDRVVLSSYGWDDINLTLLPVHEETRNIAGKQRMYVEKEVQLEVQRRLIELNHSMHNDSLAN